MAEAGYRTTPGFELRPPLLSDAPALARLSIEAFGPGDDRAIDVVERRAENLVRTCAPCSVVAERADGKLLGLAVSRRLGRVLLLAWAAVDPSVQGRGILRAMLADWPRHEPNTTRLILSSPDPRAMRAYARLGLQVLPTVSAGGILRPGAVSAPQDAAEHAPLAVVDLLGSLGAQVRGGAYPPGDVEVMDAQGDRVHVVDGRAGQAAVVRGRGVIRLLVATSEPAARSALRHALAHVPGGEMVHLNHLRAGMDWAIDEALEAGLTLSPEAPIYADAPLSPLYLPNGSLG